MTAQWGVRAHSELVAGATKHECTYKVRVTNPDIQEPLETPGRRQEAY
jgi:hypothetical protein